ncbi:MAG: methylated-DNA--[protein]-cysteine S-methyltransferase [Nitrospinota bacterium]|nr:methylated-DNA--[protein]-cysteine S-methyltransferase [Nitrospinota bacterium]
MSRPKRQEPLFYTAVPSPLGLIGLASSKKGIVRVSVEVKNDTSFAKYLKTAYRQPLVKNPQAFKEVQNQFNLYFKGKLKKFTCTLDFNHGTLFQSKVWEKLTTIPYGKTRSYLWLARAIGKPSACRAVGNANSKNPLSIIVPCHRVIRENGTLGGYTGGIDRKQFLLDLEQNGYGAV